MPGRRTGLLGPVAGIAVALLLGTLVLRATSGLHGTIAYPGETGPGGGNVLSVERQMRADAWYALTLTVVWTLAYFLGGLVAGRLARASAALAGALVAVCGAAYGLVKSLLVFGVSGLALGSGGGLSSAPEGGVVVQAAVFAVLFPLTVGAGYAGGWTGGRIRTPRGEGRRSSMSR